MDQAQALSAWEEKMLKKCLASLCASSKVAAVVTFALVVALGFSQPAIAQTKTWTGGGGNFSWHNADNWDPAGVPGASDDVLIDVPGELTVTISQSAVAKSLHLGNDVVVTNSTLTTSNGLTLDGATITLSQTGGFGSSLYFIGGGTQTLGGTGEVLLNSSGNGGITVRPQTNNTTLIIGPDIAIRRIGSGPGIGWIGSTVSSSTTINQGLISSEVATRPVELINVVNEAIIQAINGGVVQTSMSTGTEFTNDGTLLADNGTLTLSGDWENHGTITAINSTVNLGGTFTLGRLGLFNRTGGTVNIIGTLDLEGGVLHLDDVTGSWRLAGGTILDGTVSSSGSAALLVQSSSTLDGITLATDLSYTNTTINVNNGLILDGATITLSQTGGFGSSLYFIGGGTQTLGGTGEVLLNSSGNGGITVRPQTNNTTLIIGPDIAIRRIGSGPGIGRIGSTVSSSTTINQGLISSEVATRPVELINVVNEAIIQAINGGVVNTSSAASTIFESTGTVRAEGGGLFAIQSPVFGNYNLGVLLGGTWHVASGSTLNFPGGATIHTLGPDTTVILDGPNSNFPAIDSLRTINSGAAFELAGGRDFAASPGAQPFTNDGSLILGPQSEFTVASGDYEQLAGSLDMTLQSYNDTPVTIAGDAMLGGHLAVTADGFEPSIGQPITILSASKGVSGQFASASLPPASSVMEKVQLNYLAESVRLDVGYKDGAFIGLDGGDWFAPENWGAGEVPGVNTDVFLPVLVLIEAGDAFARDVLLMANGGGLMIGSGGSLTANSLTAETGSMLIIGNGWLNAVAVIFEGGSTLVLNDADALLVAQTLTFMEGAILDWTAGTIEIDGGSLVHPWEDFYVGGSSELSTLRLLNGAVAAVPGDLFIGPDENTVGAVELVGDATHLGVGGEMFVGFAGDGSLSISDGASSASGFGSIAFLPESNGIADVAGAASSWNITGMLMVGAGDTGQLQLDDGATVQAATIAIDESGTVAGRGTLAADVSNAGLISPGLSTGVLSITGDYVQGSGGALEIEMAGDSPGSQMDVLEITGTATVDGSLSIAFIDAFNPGPDVMLTFLTASEGVTGTFSDVSIDAVDDPYLILDLAVSPTAVSLITFYPDGFYVGEPGGDWFDEANWIGGVPGSQSNVILTGSVEIGAAGATAQSILVANGGALTVTTGSLAVATIEVEGGGLLELTDASAFIEAGWINLAESATLNWQAGTIIVNGGFLASAALQIGCVESAVLELNDAVVEAPEILICQLGTLRGTGWVSDAVHNAGVIEPGLPIGSLNLQSSYSQAASGQLVMQIAGLVPGQQHDVLSISGHGSFDGTLELVLDGGFEPAVLNEFTLVQADSGTGEFSTITLPELSGGLFFELVYATNVATFEVVAKVSKVGDLNGDGVVDVSDLLILLAAWGACPPSDDCPADLNGDGVVDVSDLLILLANWG